MGLLHLSCSFVVITVIKIQVSAHTFMTIYTKKIDYEFDMYVFDNVWP